MTDVFKAAFIFTAPDADPQTNSAWVKTPKIHLKTIAVSSYQQACDLLDELHQEGISAIELCAGFGHQGVARVVEAARGRMQIGVVRFDTHPGLGFRSGDSLDEQTAMANANRA